MAVAAPGEIETGGEEGLAELADTVLAHREQIVEEHDVARPPVDQLATQAHHLLDAVHASLAARGGTVAEGAGEGTAARGDQRRHGAARIAEEGRLEAVRKIGQQIPRRRRQRVEVVDVRRARIGVDASVAAIGETGNAFTRQAAREAIEQLEERDLAFADDAEIDAREGLQRPLRNGADVGAAENGDDVGNEGLDARRDARRVVDGDRGGGEPEVIGAQRRDARR